MTRLVLLSALLLAACGDDDSMPMPTPMPTGCGDVADGETRCIDANTFASCVGSSRVERSCRSGQTCLARAGEPAGCECDNAADGVCPDGCATDPDCAACEPSCGMNECGSDGCGGLCGMCSGNAICVAGACEAQSGLCTDTCGPADQPGAWAGDGACDDGGSGAEFSVCAFGSDCSDCGARDPATFDAGAPDSGSPDSSVPFDAGRPDAGNDAGNDAGPSCSRSCSGTFPYCVEGDDRGECCVVPARFDMLVGQPCGTGTCNGDSVEATDLDPNALAPFAAGASCLYDDFFDNLAVSFSNGSGVSGIFGVRGWRDDDMDRPITDFRVTLDGVGDRADGTYTQPGAPSCEVSSVSFAPPMCGSDDSTFGLSLFYRCDAALGGTTLRFSGEVGCTGFEVPTSFP